jgi:hypothetical protein
MLARTNEGDEFSTPVALGYATPPTAMAWAPNYYADDERVS